MVSTASTGRLVVYSIFVPVLSLKELIKKDAAALFSATGVLVAGHEPGGGLRSLRRFRCFRVVRWRRSSGYDSRRIVVHNFQGGCPHRSKDGSAGSAIEPQDDRLGIFVLAIVLD